MKIQPAVYSALKSDIAEVARALGVNLATSDGGKTGLKTVYLILDKACKDRAYDDTHAGFAGGHWKRILPYTGRHYCFYYEGGCNDTHVATALRSILRELLAETRVEPATFSKEDRDTFRASRNLSAEGDAVRAALGIV